MTEIFEARKPKDPAVIAEIDGTVEIWAKSAAASARSSSAAKAASNASIWSRTASTCGSTAGDFVRAGEALVDGPLVPHDILRISGEEAVQQYLTREIQNVYRSQRVEIDDKHIEIIVSQMLRKVRIESVGDTGLLPGSVMDKFEFRQANQNLIAVPEDHRKGRQRIRRRDDRAEGCSGASERPDRSARRPAAKGTKPKSATASTQLLGITKAAVQSSSFISAASFQETTKVLTEAALAGRTDHLVGLKENVILGHLIPAGTGSTCSTNRKSASGPKRSKCWRPKRNAFWNVRSRYWKSGAARTRREWRRGSARRLSSRSRASSLDALLGGAMDE